MDSLFRLISQHKASGFLCGKLFVWTKLAEPEQHSSKVAQRKCFSSPNSAEAYWQAPVLHAGDRGGLPFRNLRSSLEIKYYNTHFTEGYFSYKTNTWQVLTVVLFGNFEQSVKDQG